MPQPEFSLHRLTHDYNIKPFDCKDTDLNGFLFDDAKAALNLNLTVTYLLEDENKTCAYFSLLNDKVSIKDLRTEGFTLFRNIFKNTGFENLSSYPAVKLGRL